MRIAQVTMRFWPATGGVETHVLELSKELVKQGHEVTVFTSNLETERPWKELSNPGKLKGIKVVRLKAMNVPYYPLMRLPDLSGYDVIHVHGFPRHYADQVRGKFVITTHGLHFHKGREGLLKRVLVRLYYSTLGKRTLARAHKVICISRQEKDFLKNYCDEKKMVVIGNGIHYANYERGGKNNNLLFIGRLDEGKGIHYLIRALKGLNERLDIVGSGPEMTKLKRLVNKLRIKNQVRFHGRVSERKKISLLRDCKALILPSKYESFGIVLLEAMASGKPVIATRVGGIPELVSRKEGILIPYGDVNALRKAIIKLKDFKSKGLIKAKKYDWQEIYKKIIKVYNN